ncbi:MAG: hypothetical protein NWF06_10340 [Candidatus Bathyarchaeota archaeon]|nr:hypothetical protein [Candidatus Bathyarchaeum sp.]
MKKIWKERKKDPEQMKKWKQKLSQWGKMATQKNIKQTFSPTPELSYVLGVIEGDGFVYTCKVKRRSSSQPPYEQNIVELIVKDKEFAEEFSEAVKATINTKTRMTKTKRKSDWGTGEYYVVRTYSSPFVKWYKALTKQQLTTHIEKSGKKGIASFIRGFFDSDGTAYFKRNPVTKISPDTGITLHTSAMQRQIKIVKSDKQKILMLQHLLKNLNITTTITMTDYNGKRKNMYQIRIIRAESQVKFCKQIGSSIPRKAQTLKNILKWNLNHKQFWRK